MPECVKSSPWGLRRRRKWCTRRTIPAVGSTQVEILSLFLFFPDDSFIFLRSFRAWEFCSWLTGSQARRLFYWGYMLFSLTPSESLCDFRAFTSSFHIIGVRCCCAACGGLPLFPSKQGGLLYVGNGFRAHSLSSPDVLGVVIYSPS